MTLIGRLMRLEQTLAPKLAQAGRRATLDAVILEYASCEIWLKQEGLTAAEALAAGRAGPDGAWQETLVAMADTTPPQAAYDPALPGLEEVVEAMKRLDPRPDSNWSY
jgi:hypothetical protein